MTSPAAPLLHTLTLTPGRVCLQGVNPDGSPYALTLPRPVTFARVPQLLQPDRLTVYTLPPLAPLALAYEVEPYTREGAQVLQALGWGGPFPVPHGVSLGGHGHGAALTECEALQLAGLPDFCNDWAICPGETEGAPLTLRWADSCTAAQLEAASAWAALQTAALTAAALPPVTA